MIKKLLIPLFVMGFLGTLPSYAAPQQGQTITQQQVKKKVVKKTSTKKKKQKKVVTAAATAVVVQQVAAASCTFCFSNSSEQTSSQYWTEEKRRLEASLEQSKPVIKTKQVATRQRSAPPQPQPAPVKETKCILFFCREEEHKPKVEQVAVEAKKWQGKHQKQNRQELKQLFAQSNLPADPVVIPWCAAFANAIIARAGYETTGSLQARSFLNWGIKTQTPREGDIVVLARGRDNWSGHVGFFEGFEVIDGIKYVKVLGGNTEKAVQIGYYPISRVLGYRTAFA